MKIKAVLSNDLSGFTPRDVRNFIGSIADEKYKDYVMYHGNKLSPVIYSKPFGNSFEITFAKSDKQSTDVFSDIKEKISGNIKFYGERINRLIIDDTDYNPIPSKEMAFYKSKTPFVLAVNDIEYKILYSTLKKQDKADFINFLTRRIRDSIIFQIKEYIRKPFDAGILNDLKIYMQMNKNVNGREFVYKNIRYKDKVLPVIYLSFISNYTLPEFVGYKIGLGYGQIYAVN